MNKVNSALAKAFRQGGQALDALGRSLEVNGVVETRESLSDTDENN